MNTYREPVKKFAVVLLLICSGLLQSSHAGWLNTMKDSFTDKVSYHIRVLDEGGQPLAGAALWSSGRGEEGDLDWKAVMNRLFDRFAVDYDYARPLGLMDSRMVVEYLDAKGEFHWEWKSGKTPLIVFAALKRGYQPAVIETQSKSNTTQELVFRLKRNPAESVDPRMETFDRLRAEVFNSQRMGMMEEARETFIQNKQVEIRSIATSMEGDRPELAARVYLNLADMPSVNIFRRPDGSVTGRGFTNGYDDDDLQRRDDFERGLALDQITPEIQFAKITRQENQKEIRLYPKEEKIAAMRIGLEGVKKIVSSAPNRVWPNAYVWMVSRHIDLDDYANACKALQTAYTLEPGSESAKYWQDRASEINRMANRSGLSLNCHLPSL